MRRTGIKSVSEKRLKSGALRYGSTFAIATPSAKDRVAAMPRRSVELARGTPIKTSNPARVAKRDREYQRKLALYRRSETHRIVEERAQGRCEFYVAIVGGVRVARVTASAGSVRCEDARVGHHHAKGYARLGGKERPDEMVAGCFTCHDYVESLKLVHRSVHRSRRPA
jgi:hypothetical protein